MSSLQIVTYPDPMLRLKARRTNPLDPDLPELVQDMLLLQKQLSGVGLAAPQVGLSLQLAVIEIPEGVHQTRPSQYWENDREVARETIAGRVFILINPTVRLSKKKELGHEGCLSLPGTGGDVDRSLYVTVTTEVIGGGLTTYRAGGFLARAIQHEYDHLHGILYTDHLSREQRLACLAKAEARAKAGTLLP